MKSLIKYIIPIFFAVIFIFIINSVVLSSDSCERCPLKEICDKTTADGGINICDDTRYLKYFKENKKAELAKKLRNGISDTAEKTDEILIDVGVYEVTVENMLNFPAAK